MIAHDFSMPPTYRAWQWRGSAEPLDLRLADVRTAALAPDHVWVRNRTIGLNPVDWKLLGGRMIDLQPGKVPGVDAAGVVVAVGANVPATWLGQRVAYHQSLAQPGSFAEYTPVVARALMTLPASLDDDTAASAPCPALTAWLAMEKLPRVAGARLLIGGGGGAVGLYLLQFALARGFAVTVMSNARHESRLRKLGAVAWLPGPLTDGATLPASCRAQFFAAIDTIGSEHAQRLTSALEANGHIVAIEGRVSEWPSVPFGRCISMHEVALGAIYAYGDDAAWRRLVVAGERIFVDIADGRLQPSSIVLSDFDDLARLLHDLKNRNFSGKPLVRLPSFHF